MTMITDIDSQPAALAEFSWDKLWQLFDGSREHEPGARVS